VEEKKVPSSSKAERQLDLDHIEDFADPLGWQRIRNIREHPEYEATSTMLRSESYERGRAEEHARSQAELTSLRKGYLDRLEVLLASMTEERRRFQEENAEELLRLGLALGEKVARALMPGNTDVLKAKVDECLERLSTKSSYEIHVNDRERDLLSELLEASDRNLSPELPYRIVGDPRLEAGDVVLESKEGRIESICSEELNRLGDTLIQLSREGNVLDE
jgi:flagellar biosynthesis/type III secretory pathway protein FliH